MGLDDGLYGLVYSQILNTEPPPSMSKAFTMVNQEEKCCVVSKRDEQVEVATFTKSNEVLTQVMENKACNFCDNCLCATQTCNYFPISNNMDAETFDLI